MARGNVRLDSPGIREVLTSYPGVRSEITRLANSIEADVRSHPSITRNEMSVDSNTSTTDRFRANVTITHAGGLAAQAKYGVLTRAAASAGLEVRAK